MASPITPWDHRCSASTATTSTTPFIAPTGRLFGRNGTYNAAKTSAINANNSDNYYYTTERPTQIETPPIPRPFLAESAARRLSRRAELLDKRVNVHMRQTATPQPGDFRIAELEGTTPIVPELEGSGPSHFLAELEGDKPTTLFNAVEARVIPAGTVKEVKVSPPKKQSRWSAFGHRFRPEKVKYDVSCSNAAADLAFAAKEQQEKEAFLARLNACRAASGVPPLSPNADLSSHAQHHADNAAAEGPSVESFLASPYTTPATPRPDTVSTITSPLDPRLTAARIVSERGLGAMACVERWYSGKYKGHQIGFVNMERHPEDCPCRLKIVYETIVSGNFTKIGVGHGMEGRGVWVVEMAA